MTDNMINKHSPTDNPQLKKVTRKLLELMDDVIRHDGYGDIHVEVKILKRRQKEIIIHYGKQYRFVIDSPSQAATIMTDGDESSHHNI